MVATPGVPLLQVPPEVAFESVVVPPAHKLRVPVMAVDTGSAGTVSVCCAVFVPPHPFETVYTILQSPAATAVTKPVEEFTVATLVLLLLQAPEPPLNTAEPALYVAVAPIHNGVVPDNVPVLALA